MYIGKKKSQAALEFLTTYAWAFLVILIMIGALAYFGVLSPSNLLPERCNFGSEFQCSDFAIIVSGASPELRLKLRNNVGESITVNNFQIKDDSGSAIAGCLPKAPFVLPTSWRTGNTTDFVYDTCAWTAAGLVPGSKGKVLFTLEYYNVKSGLSYLHQIEGELVSKVI